MSKFKYQIKSKAKKNFVIWILSFICNLDFVIWILLIYGNFTLKSQDWQKNYVYLSATLLAA
jgi:hypothetical protein